MSFSKSEVTDGNIAREALQRQGRLHHNSAVIGSATCRVISTPVDIPASNDLTRTNLLIRGSVGTKYKFLVRILRAEGTNGQMLLEDPCNLDRSSNAYATGMLNSLHMLAVSDDSTIQDRPVIDDLVRVTLIKGDPSIREGITLQRCVYMRKATISEEVEASEADDRSQVCNLGATAQEIFESAASATATPLGSSEGCPAEEGSGVLCADTSAAEAAGVFELIGDQHLSPKTLQFIEQLHIWLGNNTGGQGLHAPVPTPGLMINSGIRSSEGQLRLMLNMPNERLDKLYGGELIAEFKRRKAHYHEFADNATGNDWPQRPAGGWTSTHPPREPRACLSGNPNVEAGLTTEVARRAACLAWNWFIENMPNFTHHVGGLAVDLRSYNWSLAQYRIVIEGVFAVNARKVLVEPQCCYNL